MEVGEKISFSFGKGKKEGVVNKIFPNTIYLKADFPGEKDKIIKRKRASLEKPKKSKKK